MKLLQRLVKKKPRVTTFSEQELRERLTDAQYEVVHLGKTEAPYSGEYLGTTDEGTYHCRVCHAELFSSEEKLDAAGSPWPGFSAPIAFESIAEQSDWAFGIPRTETLCADCGAHLGHVFPEGQGGKETRYCINSASIVLEQN